MATYLYGLLLARNAHLVPAHIAGIGGAAVRVLACGDVDALVSDVGARPAAPTLDDVRAHDHTLQSAVHHGVTVLATRFGQVFDDDASAKRHVSERASSRSALESRDGCVEMRLLLRMDVPQPEQPPAASGPGTRYLEELRARSASRDLGGTLGVRAAFGPIVQDERVEALPKGQGVAFSHLIRRGDEQSYRDAVAAMPVLSSATTVGPLALYSFVDARDE